MMHRMIYTGMDICAATGSGVLLSHLLEGVHCILDFLLGSGFAGELVEFLVELSPARERGDGCYNTRAPSYTMRALMLGELNRA